MTRRVIVAAGVVFVVALGCRVPFVSGFPDTPDGVRLIRGTERFDPLEFAPHFPGYPVAVAMARVLPTSGGLAWAWLGCGSGAVACAAIALVLGQRYGPLAGGAGGIVCAVQPALALESLRVATDVLVLPWLIVGLFVSSLPRGSFVGGWIIGLGLGVRPSAFAFAVGLAASPRPVRAGVGVMVGGLTWLLPTLAIVGPETYVREGVRFTMAHFVEWGGTALGPDAGSSRWSLMWTHWLVEPLGWSVLLLVLGAWAWRRTARVDRCLRAGVCAYVVWIVVAQNPLSFRHAMPVVWISIGYGVAWLVTQSQRSSWRFGAWAAVAALVAVSVVDVVDRGRRYLPSRPPVLDGLAELERSAAFDPLLDRIYLNGERAYFSWHHPEWSVATVRSWAAVRSDLAGLPIPPRRVWVSAEIPGRAAVPMVEPPVIEASRDPDLAVWGARFALRVFELEEIL